MNLGNFSIGDSAQISNSAIGNGARNTVASEAVQPNSPDVGVTATQRWDVGVVTILAEEMQAVVRILDLHDRTTAGGLHVRTGEVPVPGETLRVVATRTHSQGQRSVMASLDYLRRHFRPRLWVLAGVAGGIHDEYACIGNVIVSTRVVYYEQRKVNPRDKVQRRGEEREAPAKMVHAVNSFFTDHGDPARIPGQLPGHESSTYEVFPGLIGSGEAVIADEQSRERQYLNTYNDKVLAVDMESGGLSQYWQENSLSADDNPPWVVVRGISDNADQKKGHAHHELAAHNAAFVVRELLPYLC